jgi:hypothetical protein
MNALLVFDKSVSFSNFFTSDLEKLLNRYPVIEIYVVQDLSNQLSHANSLGRFDSFVKLMDTLCLSKFTNDKIDSNNVIFSEYMDLKEYLQALELVKDKLSLREDVLLTKINKLYNKYFENLFSSSYSIKIIANLKEVNFIRSNQSFFKDQEILLIIDSYFYGIDILNSVIYDSNYLEIIELIIKEIQYFNQQYLGFNLYDFYFESLNLIFKKSIIKSSQNNILFQGFKTKLIKMKNPEVANKNDIVYSSDFTGLSEVYVLQTDYERIYKNYDLSGEDSSSSEIFFDACFLKSNTSKGIQKLEEVVSEIPESLKSIIRIENFFYLIFNKLNSDKKIMEHILSHKIAGYNDYFEKIYQALELSETCLISNLNNLTTFFNLPIKYVFRRGVIYLPLSILHSIEIKSLSLSSDVVITLTSDPEVKIFGKITIFDSDLNSWNQLKLIKNNESAYLQTNALFLKKEILQFQPERLIIATSGEIKFQGEFNI